LKELFSIIHKYARENDLLEDPVFLVMFEDLYIAYTKFYDNNSDMYNYSRLSSNTRNQYYRANISMETQQEFLEQCLRTPTFSGTYDYMNYKLDESYIEPIKEETITPEIETVDDIDSINNYVSQTKMIDLNITQTQMMFSRDVSVGTQI